jgi:hypothetical protein
MLMYCQFLLHFTSDIANNTFSFQKITVMTTIHFRQFCTFVERNLLLSWKNINYEGSVTMALWVVPLTTSTLTKNAETVFRSAGLQRHSHMAERPIRLHCIRSPWKHQILHKFTSVSPDAIRVVKRGTLHAQDTRKIQISNQTKLFSV